MASSETHYLHQETISLYQNIIIAKKPAYYWYNATFIDNVANKQELAQKMNRSTNKMSLYAYLNYVVANLEKFLGYIQVNFKYIHNPLYPTNYELEMPIYFQTQTRPYLKYSNNISNESTSPFIRDYFFNFILNTFRIESRDIYRANKFELYPKQKTILGNAFISDGFKPQFKNPIKGSISTIEDKIGLFINSISTKINYSYLIQIKNTYTANFTSEAKIIHYLFDQYLKLEFSSTSDTVKKLHEIESKIEEITVAFFPDAEYSNEPELRPTDVDVVPKNEQVCEYITSSDSVYNILSRYPSFIGKKTHLNKFSTICPIQIKYIILTFPYYKNYKITVVDNFIITTKGVTARRTNNIEKWTNFNVVKQFTKFNGDYTLFKSTLGLFEFSSDDLDEVENVYYNMNGYKCTIIASGLLNFHFNYFIPDRNMYTLYSKLSHTQQNLLEKNFPCKTPTVKKDIIISIVHNIDVIPQNFDEIKNSCTEMLSANTFHGQVNIASKTNYNIISLIQFAKLSTNSKNFISVIPLLYLYSTAPLTLKQLVYKQLDKYTICNTFDTAKQFVDEDNIEPLPIKPYDIYQDYQIEPKNANVISDYMQYIKTEKDFALFRRVSKLFP